MRAPIEWLMVGALLCASVGTASAQVPPAPPPRPPDSLRIDSLRADSLRARRDTLSTTDRLLKANLDNRVRLQPLELCGVNGLLPAGTRMVFDRDSIDWAAAQSIGELLARVPGVFVERSDWLGMPEMPNYFAHGAASVEYVIDCVPHVPTGADSVAVDPTYPLSILDRVEVERSPGMVRVFLFTRRHSLQAPRTKIGASQSDVRGATRYFASFERRYPRGFGLSLAADYVGLNPQSNGTGGGNIPTGWLQLSYAPTYRFGIQAQAITQFVTRNFLAGDAITDTLLVPVKGTRTDVQLRASLHQQEDGLGSSLDVIAAHTSWANDTGAGSVGVGQFGAIASRRASTWSAQLAAWHYTRYTTLDSRLDLGWSPSAMITGSLQLVGQRHAGDRGSSWATARIGIKLPARFMVGGSISSGSRVQAPAILLDAAQSFTEAEAFAGFDSRLLTLDARYTRTDGWRPERFQEFAAIAGLAPLNEIDWLTAHGRISPTNWLTFDALYQHPRSGGLPDAMPPNHILATGTIRSRFLRNFPSGIFDLKLQAVMERWTDGIGGRTASGDPIALPAATFFRGIIQMQIGPFIFYYDRINLKAVRTGYVPGYQIQPAATSFGIRWEFTN